MLKFLSILIFLFSFLALDAQQVENIRVTQEGDNVVIIYDISSDKAGQTFDIKVECSADGGNTFSIIPKTLTGDIKEVLAGNGKRIVWDVLSERQELAGDQFVFQLAATVNNPEDSYTGNSGTFTDARDGQVYKWIKIGTQIWMAENLRATKFNDGTSIPNVTDVSTWSNLKTPGYCWHNNDASNKSTYGALYNWYAVNTMKLAPKGWHVPTDAEWTTLTNFVGGKDIAGGKLKEAGTTHWVSPNAGATSTHGFAALPGGYRDNAGTYSSVGEDGSWWSSAESLTNGAWGRHLYYDSVSMSRHSFPKADGFSVRCVRDY